MRGLLAQPLIHFLVVGALLGGSLLVLAERSGPTDESSIRITSTDLARLEAEWTARWNRPPSREELDGMVDASIRERVLHREALRLGLDKDEPVVRRVLVQKLERITSDLIELGLTPSDQNLEAWLAERAETYRPEPLVTFTHVFVDVDHRGRAAAADATALLADLRSRGAEATAQVDELGDRIMLERYHPRKTLQRVAALFGSDFAAAVFELEPGTWQGPVRSGYGLHLVYVHDLEAFPTPELDDVRDRVRQDWVDEKRREITESYFAELLERYEIVVEAREQTPESVGPGDGESGS